MAQFTPEKFLDFVESYDKANPKHREGMLEFAQKTQVLDASLFSDEASWVQAYRTKTRVVPSQLNLNIPFFDQKDNGPEGWRECQSSSIAMCLAFLGIGGIKDDVTYVNIVKKYGDTTERQPHYYAMKQLGYTGASFSTNLSIARIKAELNKQKPVAVGALHNGPVSKPSGGGHFVVIRGYNEKGWFVNDPYGELDLKNGGWSSRATGAGKNLLYSYTNFNPRIFVPRDGNCWGWTFS
jgi:uncharacterized protein YvpB